MVSALCLGFFPHKNPRQIFGREAWKTPRRKWAQTGAGLRIGTVPRAVLVSGLTRPHRSLHHLAPLSGGGIWFRTRAIRGQQSNFASQGALPGSGDGF
jgi:hypothetical protein